MCDATFVATLLVAAIADARLELLRLDCVIGKHNARCLNANDNDFATIADHKLGSDSV